MSHTYAILMVTPAVYDEVKAKLKTAGYDHAFIDGDIDMHGIGLRKEIVHVCDQSGQPYGSSRSCCNRCGVMVTDDATFVDNMSDYDAAPNNCSRVKP